MANGEANQTPAQDEAIRGEPIEEERFWRLVASSFGEKELNSKYRDYFEKTYRERLREHLASGESLESLLAFYVNTRDDYSLKVGMRTLPGRTPTGTNGKPTLEPDALLSDIDRARAEAFAEYQASLARALPDVRRFRSDNLLGELMHPKDAFVAVNSPLARFGPNWSQPLSPEQVLHTGKRPFGQDPAGADRLRRGISPSQVRQMADDQSSPPPPTFRTFSVLVQDLTLDPQSGYSSVTVGVPSIGREYTVKSNRNDIRWLPYVTPGGKVTAIQCWSGSLDHALQLLAERLAKMFGWEVAEAAAWVMTGSPPAVHPLKVAIRSSAQAQVMETRSSTIVIEAASWLSAKAVDNAYREAQRQVTGDKDNRPVGNKSVALVRFVSTLMNEDGRLPTVRECLASWNERYPDSRYEDERPFWRDVRRALELISNPRSAGEAGEAADGTSD